jgi:hypothetical protein
MDRLLLPLLGVRPASLISDETRVAFDAHLASSLASVHNKNSPQRFEEPTRDRPRRRHEGVFTDEFLDAFFRSLDAVLMPAVFAKDAAVRRVWAHFWAARTRSAGAFLWRYIQEIAKQGGTSLDTTRDAAELLALERSLAHAMLVLDRRVLRRFVGSRGVDLVDLTLALWVSHSNHWFELATARSAIAAARGLLDSSAEDGIERNRSPHDHIALPRKTKTRGAIRPYQALLASTKRR